MSKVIVRLLIVSLGAVLLAACGEINLTQVDSHPSSVPATPAVPQAGSDTVLPHIPLGPASESPAPYGKTPSPVAGPSGRGIITETTTRRTGPTNTPGPTPTSVSPPSAGPTPTPAGTAQEMTGRPEREEIPSGTIALYYRTSFSSDTERLVTVVPTVDSDGIQGSMVSDITWENGSKGIVRLMPDGGVTKVVKTIHSPSYAKSSIYPMTIGGRLISIRDWGSDWTGKNQSFKIEELDPETGASMRSTDINAEWFTVLDERVYYQREVRRDFWDRVTGGGQVVWKEFGSNQEHELSPQDSALHTVGSRLVSVFNGDIREHDRETGDIQRVHTLPPGWMTDLWPREGTIFYGDDALYWALNGAEAGTVHIIRYPLGGEPEVLLSLRNEGFETGLVIDSSRGQVVIGIIGSAPPKGLAILQIFVINLAFGAVEELPVEQHIPSARIEAGGGLQIFVFP